MVEVRGIGESAGDDGIEERLERTPVTALVDDHDRFGVQAQRAPGQDLEELLQCADAAWQDRKCVRTLEHLQLALVHVLDNHGFGERRVTCFALQQEIRDNADDLAAAFESGICRQPHQADATSAVNQRYAITGDQISEPGGGSSVGGIGAESGTAIDAERRRKGHGWFFIYRDPAAFRPRQAWYHLV